MKQMKPELEQLCAAFIANRDEVQKAFRRDNDALYPVCANLFCACGKQADAEQLQACRKVITAHTGLFSKFRGAKVRAILASVLAIGDDPEERMALAKDYYRLLKRRFKDSEYLVLAALLLTDLKGERLTEEKAVRGREIWRRMNRQHRMLTNKMDSIFAMLLAFSDKTDDEAAADLEACYQTLKTAFSSSGDAQTAAQVLSVTAGAPEEKAQRVIDLYNALQEAGVKYGKAGELPVLAALSLADVPVAVLAEEIGEADAFLAGEKGYGTKDEELKQRAMHAAMIVSDQYAGTGSVNATVTANTLNVLIAKGQAARISTLIEIAQGAAGALKGSGGKTEKTGDESPEMIGSALGQDIADAIRKGAEKER